MKNSTFIEIAWDIFGNSDIRFVDKYGDQWAVIAISPEKVTLKKIGHRGFKEFSSKKFEMFANEREFLIFKRN